MYMVRGLVKTCLRHAKVAWSRFLTGGLMGHIITTCILCVIFLTAMSVFRRGHTVLRASLPDKEEHVILVKMSPIQRRLYSAFIDTLKEDHLEGWANSNPLKAFAACCKVSLSTIVKLVWCIHWIGESVISSTGIWVGKSANNNLWLFLWKRLLEDLNSIQFSYDFI